MQIREFRANMKSAFDAAKAGEKVEIRRDGVDYLLVSVDAVKKARKQPTPENKKNYPEAPGDSLFDTNPSFNERNCCQKSAPCKHWEWNSNMKKYVNKLSGREREVEGGDWGA